MGTSLQNNKTLVIDVEKIKSLGNNERLKILQMLIINGPMSWTNIQNKLQINPNSLNFHLNKLVHNELIGRKVVENEKRHPGTEYSILKQGEKLFSHLQNEVVK